jgi:hypothetical protein
VPVALSATSTLQEDYLLAVFRDIAKVLSCLSVIDHSAARHLNNLVLAILSEAFVLAARLTVTGKGVAVVAQMEQSPVVTITAQDDMATSSTIATIGTTVRTIFLTPHVSRSATTLSGAAVYLYIINKVRFSHIILFSLYSFIRNLSGF